MYDDKNIPQTDFKTIDDLKKYKEYFGEIFYDIAKNKLPNNDTKIKDIMVEMGKLENDLGEELQKIEDTIKRKPPFKDNVVFGKKRPKQR